MQTILSAKAQDDLLWDIPEETETFLFDLGLSEPCYPLEDELLFQSALCALKHFSEKIFPLFPSSEVVLFRGPMDFSRFFHWSDQQKQNYFEWKKKMAPVREEHLKRIFCLEAFSDYFQLLSHHLPEDIPITIALEGKRCGSLAETLHLLSPERFEHFRLESELRFSSSIGVCFPHDGILSEAILEKIDAFLPTLPSFRPIYESLFTEGWDGLDEIYVFTDPLEPFLQRKILGFEAAGGKVFSLNEEPLLP